MHAIAAQLLKANPDVGLDVLDQVAQVDVAVGVGQGRGDEDRARRGRRGRLAGGGCGRHGAVRSKFGCLARQGAGCKADHCIRAGPVV